MEEQNDSTEQQTTEQQTNRPPIDPPAADTARRARERREALLARLEEEKALRIQRKEELDALLTAHDASMREAKFKTSIIPTS
jgi:hypothetical protein